MKKFLEDLETELRKNKVAEDEIKEILNDHKEMMEEAISEGLSEEELETKFGDPIKVAKELAGEKVESEEQKDFETEEIDEEDHDKVWKFDAKDGYEIDLNLVSEDVNIHRSSGNSLVVAFSGRNKADDYTVEFVNNKLIVSLDKKIKIRFNFRRSDDFAFDLYLPAEVKLSFCKLQTVSGDFNIKNLISEDLHIKTTSGDTELNVIKTDDLKLESVSGDFSLEDVFAVGCYISLVSGDIEAEDFRVKKNIILNTVSGDVEFEDVECNDMEFRTVSGDFEGTNCYPRSVALKSVSGDISIENEDRNRQINIRSQKSVSGDVRIITK